MEVSGTQKAKADLIKEMLSQWGVKGELIAMEFDTTISNNEADLGACRFLELWLDTPIIWLGCHPDIYKIHITRLIQEVM